MFSDRDLGNDVTRIRCVIDHVMKFIEENGILTEGLYRRSGTQSKVKKLHRKLLKASSSKGTLLNGKHRSPYVAIYIPLNAAFRFLASRVLFS